MAHAARWDVVLAAWLATLGWWGGGAWSAVEVALCGMAVLLVVVPLAFSPQDVRARLPRVAWAWAASVVLLGVLHLVPLPWPAWSGIGGRRSIVEALRAAGVAEGWRPFTLDPDAASLRLSALMIGLAAWVLATRRRWLGVDGLLGTVVAVALTGSVAAGLQAVGMDVGGPPDGEPQGMSGWFANRNLFAAQQAVGLVLAVSLCLRARVPVRRALWAGACVALGAGLVVSQSRAGIALGLSSALGLAAWHLLHARGRAAWRIAAAAAVAAGLCASAAVALFADRHVVGAWSEQLSAGGRLALWTELPAMETLGVGLGAFEQWYQQSPGAMVTDARVHHVHNDWLELWVELGVPFVLLALAGVAGLLRATRRAFRAGEGARAAACATALGLLAAHSLVDTPLRASANLASFALLCAALLQLGSTQHPHRSHPASTQ